MSYILIAICTLMSGCQGVDRLLNGSQQETPIVPRIEISQTFLGKMHITSYRSVREQTDSTPFITASGERVHNCGVALSRNLLKRWGGVVQYGDLIYIEGFGLKRVNDTMNPRHSNHVDIWVKTHKEEQEIGWTSGRVWLIKTN